MRDIPTEQGNLFFALKRAHHDLTVAMAREVSVASGVPSAQAAALVYLVQHDGCSVGYLGDLLGLNSAGTAGLVTRLVRDDLVQKSANASDARVTQLHATARGRRVARRIKPLLKQLDSQLRAGFSAAEVAVIERFLTHVSTTATDLNLGKR